MSSRFEKDDGRHYENPYEDYDASARGNLVNPGENDIQNDFKKSLESSTKSLLQQLEKNRKNWDDNDGSIYTGIPGIAYMFYAYGKIYDQPEYISRAKELLERAEKPTGKHCVTFLTGRAGPIAISAVINHRDMDQDKYQTSISKLKNLSKYVLDRGSVPDEMLYGKSGYLFSLLFVNNQVTPHPFDGDLIKQIISAILESGKNYAKKNRISSPLMYAWHDSEYLGGAHGLAGILYVLLQARQYLSQEQLEKEIEPSLKYLLDRRYPSGNFLSSVGSNSDRLVHWCHGAPSMTMLFCLAYEIFGKEEYLNVALECGEVIWARGLLKKGYGICHGVSGNAYSFLSLFQQTKDAKHLYRACKFAEWCMDYGTHQTRNPDRPLSLFEGLAGTIYFLIDLLHPQDAKFPGYTL